MKLQSVFLTAAILTLQSIHSSAATLYVSLNCTNPVPPYSDWSTAATNIQDAVDVATNGDIVLVTNGVYASGIGIGSDGSSSRVAVNGSIALQSVNGLAATVINGGHSVRCVSLTNGATLTGFTLTNGIGLMGGGLYCASSNEVASNCLLINNSAASGGGGSYRERYIIAPFSAITPSTASSGAARMEACSMAVFLPVIQPYLEVVHITEY